MTLKKKARNNNKPELRFGYGITRRRVMVVAALVLLVWGACYYSRITAGYNGDKAAWIHIPQNADADAARDSIRAALPGSYGQRVAAMWNGDVEASHGAYRVEPGEKVWRVARKIGLGRQTPVKITFNNVRTLQQLAQRIADCMEWDADDFVDACSAVADSSNISLEQLEVKFLPDTYEAYWTASPKQIIDKLVDNYTRFWTAERLAKAQTLNLTPMQVSIVASIAEEESNQRDERPKIARLYLNRLQKGMKLQADPTVKFASGDFAARRITAEMLKVDSPYNTYRYVGLPPGIIRFPDVKTLDAVLNAPQHSFIYMCARPDGSGYHDFTNDYATHLANARNYRNAVYGN